MRLRHDKAHGRIIPPRIQDTALICFRPEQQPGEPMSQRRLTKALRSGQQPRVMEAITLVGLNQSRRRIVEAH